MKRLSEIRRDARTALRGHWGIAVVTVLVFFLIELALTAPGTLGSLSEALPLMGVYNFITDTDWPWFLGLTSLPISVFVFMPLGFGLLVTMLELVRGHQNDTLRNLFHYGFGWKYWRSLGCVLLVTIYSVLWTLLLIIPGIIKVYAYSMSYYIVRDCPNLKVDDCIYLSRKMMKGYKFKLFLLDLSFIGWGLLCILTAGIGFFWLLPYFYASRACFYEERKSELQADPRFAALYA